MKKYKISITGATAYIKTEQDSGIIANDAMITICFDDKEHYDHLASLKGQMFNVEITKKYGADYRKFDNASSAVVWSFEPEFKSVVFLKCH